MLDSTGVGRPPIPELFCSSDEIAGLLYDFWAVVVNEARPRMTTAPEGAEVTIHDATLRATRRRNRQPRPETVEKPSSRPH